MVTLVGMQSDFGKAIQEMIELEYDAVDAYAAAVNRLENQDYREKLQSFQKDHEHHIERLSDLLKHNDLAPPKGASMVKHWITTTKSALSQLMGDTLILRAIHSNEEDTHKGYERLVNHDKIWPDAQEVLEGAFADEKKHKEWLESVLNQV